MNHRNAFDTRTSARVTAFGFAAFRAAGFGRVAFPLGGAAFFAAALAFGAGFGFDAAFPSGAFFGFDAFLFFFACLVAKVVSRSLAVRVALSPGIPGE